MKPTLLTRLKSRTGPRPITASEALYEWYHRGVDANSRLAPKSKLMLSWLCVLASGQDLAPLWYGISEIGRKFKWPEGRRGSMRKRRQRPDISSLTARR